MTPAARYLSARTLDTAPAHSGPPGPGEVELAPAYVGICGTDLHIFHGDMDARVTTPAVLGHEMAGRVVRVGPDVENRAPGDAVTVMPLRRDDTCPACRKGHQHICRHLDFIGIDSPGAMQQRWTVPASTLVRLPDSLPLDRAALVEPTAVAATAGCGRSGIAGAFPQAPTPAVALRALDRTHYTRLNARYRPAHTWAPLLLRGGGVTDLLTDHGAAADGLLLAMPVLWEAVVRRLCTEAVGPHGGHAVPGGSGAGITVRGDLGNASTFRPDLLLSLPGHHPAHRALLPVDAPVSVIVHPQQGSCTRRTHIGQHPRPRRRHPLHAGAGDGVDWLRTALTTTRRPPAHGGRGRWWTPGWGAGLS
ncbi:alcohol dehydrogenase catalytic domain-containing protein [Streptomyces sp. NPDC005476]|uniref:alcohol dehydrogenase catalytic domain-containing protein n=1 Tax=Streptomyces sp. NPDC005476 TaxID=3156882 RepID=UPI00345413FF